MYCANQKILFIHIPKTGGQSITNALLRFDGLNWDGRHAFKLAQNFDPNDGPPQSAHLMASEYLTLKILTQTQFVEALKFSVVRNPWDRLWSEYNFNWADRCTWDDFFDISPHGITDDYETGRDAARHIKPQWQFLMQGIEILRFENLANEFSALCDRYGLSPEPKLDRLNVSDSRHYTEVYDAQKIETVRQFYAVDIEAFDYEFGA